jgi:hypothetical protein
MIVKEASYLSLEWRRLLQITDGTGAVEELPLELRRNSIPAHKHGIDGKAAIASAEA